jgi:hypothetical protein
MPGIRVHRQTSIAVPHTKDGRTFWTSRSNDIFGCVDLLAIGPDEVTSKPLFIQCTLHTGIGKKEQDMMAVPWDLQYACVEIWQQTSPKPRTVVIRRLVKCADGLCFVKWAKIVNGKYEQIRDGNPAHLS